MADNQSPEEWQIRKRDSFYNQAMLDIETLGTDPGAAIVSIGACVFDLSGIHAEFYEEVDRESCEEAGLTVDQGTLDWWEGQGPEAREVLEGGDPIEDVLRKFNSWYKANEVYEVWAKSPAFDCVLMQEAYDAVDPNLSEPWGYDETRDMRTIQQVPMAAWRKQKGTAHHALDDAKHQAKLVRKSLTNVKKAADMFDL